MAKMMKTESIVESAISSWLNELYISGFDKMTMLKKLPIRPTVPKRKLSLCVFVWIIIMEEKCWLLSLV